MKVVRTSPIPRASIRAGRLCGPGSPDGIVPGSRIKSLRVRHSPRARLRAPVPRARGRADAGQSLIELALVLALMLSLALSVIDSAFLYRAYMQANTAASAGAIYGSNGPTQAADTVAIRNAALASAPSWGCAAGPTINSSVGTDGNSQKYVSVTVQCVITDTIFVQTLVPQVKVSGSAVRQVRP